MFFRGLYRSRQFFRSVGASISDDERAEVAHRLSPAQQGLFFAMTVRDQRHSVDVLRTLMERGQTDGDLLTAALLHDVGKGRIRLWHRVAYVLIRAVSPRLLLRLTASGRGGLAAIKDHAGRGAALAEAAGASEEVVRLIRCHEGLGDNADPRVAILCAADEIC